MGLLLYVYYKNFENKKKIALKQDYTCIEPTKLTIKNNSVFFRLLA